jgi:two-component system NtrC family sensor kinase
VAGTWRIRHKLLLGMGLMVAVQGLLLVGTVKGLTSYKATMTTIGSKLDELEEADNVRAAIKALGEPSPNPQTQAVEIRDKTQQARDALAKYQSKLQENVEHHEDRDYGYKELEQVKGLEDWFSRLDKALIEASEPRVYGHGHEPQPNLIREESPVRNAINELIRTSGDLNNVIYREIDQRIRTSRNDYRFTLAFVVATCIGAVLLMAGLLRFFYKWVCYPIRDLEQGVSRVARGDFEHRIEVHSRDEIEDLAKAFNDMTSRLREMYQGLAQQVNERSRQLVRSERLAGVGFLAAGVAHEINNPLASIAFCSEALEHRLQDLFQGQLEEADDQEKEIITKYLKMIQEEAFRCKEITQRLLAFSRGGELKREPTDLGDLVQGVLDIVEHLQNCKGKDIVFESGAKIQAWANGQEIKQVFLNLVVNALESMDDGGKLIITQQVREGMAELTFRDTGCGMSAEVLENIFEPFFTKNRTGKGTGLGLSISHRIINQHGGEIMATSAGPNQGSTFTVRLPLEPVAGQHGSVENLDPEEEFVKLSSATRAA